MAHGSLALRGVFLVALGATTPGAALAAAAGCPPPAAGAAERWSGEHAWQALQADGFRYGAIHIHVDNVYDRANPAENAWYTRAADALHIRTRDWVVRHLLLIRAGQPVDAQQVYEAIRRLRTQTFLRAADIVPEQCTGRRVDVRVLVRDAWTLNPDLEYGHAGGATRFRVDLDDANFLGTGRKLKIGHVKTPERSMNVLEFTSPTFANTDWTMAANYQDLSDGRLESLAFTRPFLLDTTPWSAGVSLLDQRLDLHFENQGTNAWLLPQRERQFQASWQKLLSFDGVTAVRAGWAFDYERYRYGVPIAVNPDLLPPPAPLPRTLAGMGPTFSLHQDRYASFENIRQIGRVEDYDLGWDVSAQALWDATTLGASANGPVLTLAASKGFVPARAWLVLANASVSGRHEHGIWRNVDFTAASTAYGQLWPLQTLVFHVDYAALLHPDPENRLYIGGFEALRGYPTFFATGNRRVRMTIADRIVTPIVWFHTFRVGFVAFSDNAMIDRGGAAGWSPWYSSVGGGLRIGNLRGSFDQVLYFTVAEPLRTGPGVGHGPEFVAGDVIDF